MFRHTHANTLKTDQGQRTERRPGPARPCTLTDSRWGALADYKSQNAPRGRGRPLSFELANESARGASREQEADFKRQGGIATLLCARWPSGGERCGGYRLGVSAVRCPEPTPEAWL